MIRLAGACLLMAGCGALGLGAVGRLDGDTAEIMKLGWKSQIHMREGLRTTVDSLKR